MPQPNDYTVGWICAIREAYVAARALLDEENEEAFAVSPNDNNAYTLGKMGEHHVVIAVLPEGEYGTSSAANVARDMLHSFSNVRIGLMVGIGGGAPSRTQDIRLGDAVVSAPRDGKGGVFQYDFGKTIQDQSFRQTGFLNQPPVILRTAMTALRGKYELDGHSLDENVKNIIQKRPRLQKRYSRPDPSSDRLYRSEVVRPVHLSSCILSSGPDLSKLVLRSERTKDEDNPAIHYGVIASGNQLMEDALIRDKLAAEEGILCFETEAAGLMNHFPCIVIRGICDYSDSHKNKEWQGYAAMVAAAYARDLLCRIAPSKVEAEKKIAESLSGLHEVSKEHRDIGKEQLQIQRNFAEERFTQRERECHQLFRLINGSKDATYEWYKGRVEKRVEGTCMWFIDHEHFQWWLGQDFGPLLVTADPGCGKSVLAKYLIDHHLPQALPKSTICYFFFKDQDQNTIRQALCAILHQLFTQKPPLIKHAITQFDTDGRGLINSTESLWKVLRSAVEDPQAGHIIIILDALDECAKFEFMDLMRNIESQFPSKQLGRYKLRYLLTCRPYSQIISEFHGLLCCFPSIRIPGEEESETISQEVNRVVLYRVDQLSTKKGLSSEIKSHLELRLQNTSHRTYLWVYLVFDSLEKEDFKKTIQGVKAIINTLPRSVNEAYEQILRKSQEDSMVRKALSIILAASRPLTLIEMNIAIHIDDSSRSIYDLDLEDENDFKMRLRSWCGLFVSVYRGNIYFLHQTAREFLLRDSLLLTTTLSECWCHSITTTGAHRILAVACVRYLNFYNLDTDAGALSFHTQAHAFLDYSAKYWGTHFREADISDDDAIIPFTLGVCNTDSRSYLEWSAIYWPTSYMDLEKNFTDLMVASYYGHTVIVKRLLDNGANIEATDENGQTPLGWAANNGHGAVVKLLLDNGANIKAGDGDGRTLFGWAAGNGHEAVVKLLLDNGANIEAADRTGWTPLGWAASNGHKAVSKLLLDNGANTEAADGNGWTPLGGAATNGHEAVVKLLLDNDAKIEAADGNGRTPLGWAAGNGHAAVFKLLLDNGANTEAADGNDRTPLGWAATNGHEAISKLLLDNGANTEAADGNGRTPLGGAATNGHEAVVKLLLDNGAKIEAADGDGWTPLWWAASNGYEAVVRLLLDNGANTEAADGNGQTPLWWATGHGHGAVVKLLLDNGASTETAVRNGQTPLGWAVTNGACGRR